MIVANVFGQLSLLVATASAFAVMPHEYVLRSINHNGTNSSGVCEYKPSMAPSQMASDLMASDLMTADINDLETRAPSEHKLLSKSDFGGSQTQFLTYLRYHAGNDIPIYPSSTQTTRWLVGTSPNQFPVGAMAFFYRFGSSPKTFVMRGMSGCTAAFLANPEGLWAAHWWESSSTINGPSAFLKRTPQNPDVTVERTSTEFAQCATDIIDKRLTHSYQRDFESLRDIKSDYDDPFHDKRSVHGFVFTKKNSPTSSSPRYPSKITALTNKIRSTLSGMRMHSTQLYIGRHSEYPSSFPADLKGVLTAQYTPCDHKDSSGNCIAAFEAYAENGRSPVFKIQWKY